MPNGYKLVWSDNALKDLKNILLYLENNWPDREIKKFVKKLDFRLNLIEGNPLLFPQAKKKSIRRSVLTYQVTIYYRINGKSVNLISLFDTRQNPKKLKL